MAGWRLVKWGARAATVAAGAVFVSCLAYGVWLVGSHMTAMWFAADATNKFASVTVAAGLVTLGAGLLASFVDDE